jgi:hypothetical protein
METFDLEFTELQLTMNNIQCNIINIELNELRHRLNAVEAIIRDTTPTTDMVTEFIPRKKQRTRR